MTSYNTLIWVHGVTKTKKIFWQGFQKATQNLDELEQLKGEEWSKIPQDQRHVPT